MIDLVLIISFAAMLLAGDWVVKKIDSFITRNVVKYPGTNGEEESHDRSDPATAE